MISAKITPIGDQFAYRLGIQRPQQVYAGVSRAIVRWAIRLVRYIQEQKLDGQALQVRTGRLRRSITYRVEGGDGSGGSFRAYVGTVVEYAAAHEYGFSGSVMVKAHQRYQSMVFGRPMKDPRMVDVRAHAMKMNLPEKSFLRSSLEENSAAIVADIRAAAVAAARGESS